MEVNADFSQRVVLRPEDQAFVPSPMAGVERVMLDRIGAEVARATSLVRYEAGSSFSAHAHDMGEEFLVIEGVFSDESGDFPAGSYVRNPPGSSHAPSSADGCTIFVKLRQFDQQDQERVVVDIQSENAPWQATDHAGVEVLPLHRYGDEDVAIYRLAPGASLNAMNDHGGAEIYVLEGTLEGGGERYPRGTWLRLPVSHNLSLHSKEGARYWMKIGHLASTG